jgi:hypothetical protein
MTVRSATAGLGSRPAFNRDAPRAFDFREESRDFLSTRDGR